MFKMGFFGVLCKQCALLGGASDAGFFFPIFFGFFPYHQISLHLIKIRLGPEIGLKTAVGVDNLFFLQGFGKYPFSSQTPH